MVKSNKLSYELKTLLQSPTENLNSYDWTSLEINQIINCVMYLKVTNQLDKLGQLITTLLEKEQDHTAFCIFSKYPALISQTHLKQVDILLRVMSEHTRNCKYISDIQWKLISDYSQKHIHVNYIPTILRDIVLQPQYHEYIAKFIQFNVQVYQLDKILGEQDIIASRFIQDQSKDSIMKLIKYIKTTKWYKDNLVGDEVGYNIEKCPVEGINAQDLRDLFE